MVINPPDLRINPDLPMSRQWIVVDLDGTLCNFTNRVHLALLAKKSGEHRDWERFHAQCGNDLPNWPVVFLLRAWLAAGGRVVYISARPSTYRRETQLWLRALGLPETPLALRIIDGQPSVDMKTRAVETVIPDGDSVAFVLEDRDKLVAMWRSYGAGCFQVAEGLY